MFASLRQKRPQGSTVARRVRASAPERSSLDAAIAAAPPEL